MFSVAATLIHFKQKMMKVEYLHHIYLYGDVESKGGNLPIYVPRVIYGPYTNNCLFISQSSYTWRARENHLIHFLTMNKVCVKLDL